MSEDEEGEFVSKIITESGSAFIFEKEEEDFE
jgi:hypothetical protein